MKNREAMLITLKRLKNILVNEVGEPICALGELVNKCNHYSAHHIVPVRKRGRTVPTNIIPLSEDTHPQFNYIEQRSHKKAKVLNDGFTELIYTLDPFIVPQLYNLKEQWLIDFDYDNEKRLYLKK